MARKLPKDWIDRIRNSTNLVELVGEVVVLQKSGQSYKGLCPFHSERSASFQVNENKQFYHCFGCKKHGDVFQFVMETEGVGFSEALGILSERARIALPAGWALDRKEGESPEAAQRRADEIEKKALAHRLVRFIAAFYHRMLERTPEAMEYLLKRGLKPATLREYYLGYAPAEWEALYRECVEKKAPIPLATELGVMKPSNRGTGMIDLFRDRVMFPILDLRGRVAGFGGRILHPELTDGPKYLNSPESILFHKSRLLFGLYQAQREIRERSEVLVVEGYFDVLVLVEAGIRHVVSPCGTALSPEGLQQLNRLADRIVLVFDGDSAGAQGAVRVMEMALEHGIVVFEVVLPEGLDPDELVLREGAEAFRARIAAARPMLDARIEAQIKSAEQGPEAKTQALKQIGEWLRKLSDPVGRQVRIEEVQRKLGLGGAVARSVFGGAAQPLQQPQRQAPVPTRPSQAVAAGLVSSSEKTFLRGILSHPEWLAEAQAQFERLPPGGVSPWERIWVAPEWREWFARFDFAGLEAAVRERAPGLPESLRAWVVESLVADPDKIDLQEWRSALEWLVVRSWTRHTTHLRQTLRDAEREGNSQKQSEILKEVLDVQRKMQEFKTFYDQIE